MSFVSALIHVTDDTEIKVITDDEYFWLELGPAGGVTLSFESPEIAASVQSAIEAIRTGMREENIAAVAP